MHRLFKNISLFGDTISGKIVLSFLIFLLSIVILLIIRTSDRLFCALAMLFSFLGDVALNYQQGKRPLKAFIAGGISFAIAHLLYFLSYYHLVVKRGYNYLNGGVFFAVVILVAVTIFLIVISKKKLKMLLLGILYLWISGINYITIGSYSYSTGSFAGLGALLFLVSDVIIGAEQLANYRSFIARELVWWLYPLGQIIIIICA